MEVMTEFTPERGLTYTVVAEGGSSRIRNRALRNVLDREVEASRNAEARAAAFSTENYRYQLGGVLPNAVQIGLMPRREDPRLINGLATMDQRTAELSYVEGDLAKNPSFWVRDVRIARRYSKVGSSLASGRDPIDRARPDVRAGRDAHDDLLPVNRRRARRP